MKKLEKELKNSDKYQVCFTMLFYNGLSFFISSFILHVFSISILIAVQTYPPPPYPLYALVLNECRMSSTGLNLKSQMRGLWP